VRSVAGSGQHLRAKEGGRVCRHDASHIGFSSLDLETTVTRLAPPAPRGARCSLWDLNTRSQWVKSLCNALALSSRERRYACPSPSGVLRHRDDPFAVPPRSLRPCPHRCCHCCCVRAGCSLWLCTRPTARTALQVCDDAPRTCCAHLERPNCTHACDSAACHLGCLCMCLGMGGVDQFVPLPDGRAWEDGGRRAIPKPTIWADPCLGRRGFSPSQPRLLAPVGRGLLLRRLNHHPPAPPTCTTTSGQLRPPACTGFTRSCKLGQPRGAPAASDGGRRNGVRVRGHALGLGV